MVPNGWNFKELAEVCSKPISYGIVQTGSEVNEGIPCVRVVDLTKQKLKTSEMILTSQEIHQSYKKTILQKNELMMALRGEIGLIRIVTDNLVGINITRGIARLAPKINDIDPNYLLWAMRSSHVKNDLMRKAGGSALQEIALTALRKVKVPVPPLPEQRKIAKILSTWDKAISTTERLIDNSKQQKKALMQQLLTGKKRLLDDSGKPFEGVWEEVKLKECATCLDNKRVPLNSSQRQEMQGEIPYWGANGIVDYVNEHIFDETIVLLAEDGGYFDEFSHRPIANISYGKSWVNNHAHILKAKNNSLNEWLYYSLVHKNILAFINGGTRAKLNKSDMLLIPINLPPIAEQTKIVGVLGNADQEISLLENQLADLKQEKKALMQQLLTGKRRVKIDNKECVA